MHRHPRLARRHPRAVLALAASATLVPGLLVATAPSGSAAPPDAGPGTAVYLVQALPQESVSLTVDGDEVGSDLASGAVVGPMDLAPGPHQLTVTGQDPDWTMQVSVQVPTADSADVVVHRPASPEGDPTVTVYRAPDRPVATGRGRVLLAHTATVPPADVRVDGQVVFANIANGEFVEADLAAGTHEAELVPTGLRRPVLLGPLDLPVRAGTLTSVYAVGNPDNGSMDVVVHTQRLRTRGSDAPDEIDTGSAGLVADVVVPVTPVRRRR